MIITQTEANPALVAAPDRVLRLQMTPGQRVCLLLEKVQKATEALPLKHRGEVLEILRDWKDQFFRNYRIDSPVDNERIAAAHALLFLRHNNMRYMMLNYAVGNLEKIEWLQIYNEFANIVASILPADINVKAFIAADEKKQLEFKLRYKTDQAARECLQRASVIFIRLKQILSGSVDQVNCRLQAEFEEIKQLLLDLNNERRVATDQLHEDLDRLTQKVGTIYQEVEQQLKETQEFGKSLQVQETNLMKLLDDCEGAIKCCP